MEVCDMAIRVEIESEVCTSRNPARVLVYENDQLIAVVTAGIEQKQGADGGYYSCVELKRNADLKPV